MSYFIHWTTEAKETFRQNIAYLEMDWNNTVINRFLDRVDEAIQNISENPFLYSSYQNSPDIRKCVVNKRIILYYRILDKQNIDLITFWNTYQDPDSLEL